MSIGILLMILIYGFLFMQLYSWLTPADATLSKLGLSGASGGIIGYIIDRTAEGSEVINAAWNGAYGANGYFLVFSLVLFTLVMMSNALSDITKNRPVRLIH